MAVLNTSSSSALQGVNNILQHILYSVDLSTFKLPYVWKQNNTIYDDKN